MYALPSRSESDRRMNLDQPMEWVSAFLDRELFTVTGQPITIANLAIALVIVLVAFWVSSVVQRIIQVSLNRRGIEDEGTVGATKRLTHYLIILVGMAVAVQSIGINLSTLFAAGAVVAVGIGFALQNILQNFISGLILLTERSIKPADILEVDGMIVRVVEMRARSTVARTLDEEELIIPNSLLVQSTVKNHTLRDTFYRVRARVGVSYSSDVDRVTSILLETGKAFERRHRHRDPVVLLQEFGDSSVVFELSVWIENPWFASPIRSDLNFKIWHALKKGGITIAFPQLDVHMHGTGPSAGAS